MEIIHRLYVKELNKFQKWFSQTKRRKIVLINMYRRKQFSKYVPITPWIPSFRYFFNLRGHRKCLAYSAPIANEETFLQSIFDACQTTGNRSLISRPTPIRTFFFVLESRTHSWSFTKNFRHILCINPYPTAFPYGNGMVLHFYQQQESSTTKTVQKVINKGLKTYV